MSFNYKTMLENGPELMFKTINKITGLTSLSILVTIEATLIRLGYNLYHFEAKTKDYHFHEDNSTQFAFDLGRICKLQNQNSLSVWL